jgi:DNA mismatch repair protein MSH6
MQPNSKIPKTDGPKEEVVGKRVAVFWPADDEWYNGTVQSYEADTGLHAVLYDDDEVEKVLLGTGGEKWKRIDGPAKKLNAEEPKTRVAAKPKKRKIESDSESEEDAAEGGSDSGDGSEEEYKGSGQSSSESEDDEHASASDSDADDKPQRKRLSQKNRKASSAKKAPSAKAAVRKAPPQKTKAPAPRKPAASQAKKPPPQSSPRAADDEGDSTSTSAASSVIHDHHELTFLKNRKDANRRAPDDPEFDKRTLYVPPTWLKEQTPAMIAWWEFKAQNFDTVLFFKVGKFYELFHMDADVGVKELDCVYMKGKKAHCGFPEIGYGKYAKILVDRNYRVSRVEQTETPEMLKERVIREKKTMSKSALEIKKDKAVRREMCNMMSKGTRTFDHIYRDYDVNMAAYESEDSVMLAVKQRVLVDSAGHGSIVGGGEFDTPSVEFGLCLVDPATGKFQIGQFTDNELMERLQTVFSVYPVVEVVYGLGALTETALNTIRHCAPGTIMSPIADETEFVNAEQTKKDLEKYKYFTCQKGVPLEKEEWPALLQHLMQQEDEENLALSALGGCLWHLRRSLIDHDLASMGQFTRYVPKDGPRPTESASEKAAASQEAEEQPFMTLDCTAINNLEILRNSYDGGKCFFVLVYVLCAI